MKKNNKKLLISDIIYLSDKMKKIVIILLLIICTGCTIVRIDTDNIENITTVVLSKENKLYNRVGKGYKYYLPRGALYIDTNDFNEKLYSGGNYYYLFVDAVSYYHKTKLTCNFDENAYYKKEVDNGKGCLQITEQNNKYLIRFFYNYSRIEALVSKNNLNQAVLDASYILSTVKFNDTIIKTLLDNNYFNNTEKVYDKFTSNSEIDNFYRTSEENIGKVGE